MNKKIITKLQKFLVVCHCMNYSYCSTCVANRLLDEIDVRRHLLRFLLESLLLFLLECFILFRKEEEHCFDALMTSIIVYEHGMIHIRKHKSTFSVIGNRNRSAHTGLGTMLRGTGSNPHTSPNFQVGFIPKQLTNYTKETEFI